MSSTFGGPGDDRRATPLVRIADESLTLALTGALTAESVPMIRLHLLTLAATWGPDELLLNLAGVHAVDVAGAEPLLEAQGLQHARGATLALTEISPAVMAFLQEHPRFAQLLIPRANGAPMGGVPIRTDAGATLRLVPRLVEESGQAHVSD